MPTAKKANQHEASASATGYLFQSRLALLMALRAIEGSANQQISIEKLDDVAFEQEGSPTQLIQTKHHLGKRGSLTDSSVDLWKTLHIWIKQTLIDPEMPFRTKFVLLTTAAAPEGSAASFLRSYDRNEKKADVLLLAAAHASANKTNSDAYTSFQIIPESTRLNLLKAITVLDSAPNIIDTHEDICRLVRLAVAKAHVEHFVERLEGWWFGVVVRALSGTGPREITVLTLENRIDELREEFQRNSLPIDFSSSIPPASVISGMDKRRFVQQLRDVEVGEARVEYAIRDFYRASEQRSKWAREELLVDGEMETFQRVLVEAWEPRHAAMREELPTDCDASAKAKAGQSIYKWAETEADFPLRGTRQRFLTHGSFHILANQDQVGWHPDYKERSKQKTDGPIDE